MPGNATVPSSPRRAIALSLAALYLAQGIPFGFATEYLPVVLREAKMSYSQIAALGWLQLPWQLKIFWAKLADHPRLRPHARFVILAMQAGLTLTVAAFALPTAAPLHAAPVLWFALTFLAALLASTQDVFVDAFAVRVLRPEERGYGNTAQVAGYRLGMLVGGAALLLLVGRLGETTTFLACAGVVAAASIGAFASSAEAASPSSDATTPAPSARPARVGELVRHLVGREARTVLLVALTFKLGLHMAGVLFKPMVVDYGWTKEQIGGAVVTVGSVSALAGAAAGGMLHRLVHEKRALGISLVFQALVCAPLVLVDQLHAPIGLTTFAFALEHFGTGVGTTVLFAALMSATRPADAGLHYTILQSANAAAIGIGGQIGAALAGAIGKSGAFAVATVVCLLPWLLVRRWDRAAEASRGGGATMEV